MAREDVDWLHDNITRFDDEESCYQAWVRENDYELGPSTSWKWIMVLSQYEDDMASMAADRRYALMKEGY